MTKKQLVLAFVPQKAGTDPSKPDDRKFINTHLSRRAADRRRQGKPKLTKSESSVSEDAKALSKAPKLQISRVVPKYVARPLSGELTDQSANTPTTDSSPGVLTDASGDGSNETEAAKDTVMPTVPITSHTDGNYDPFVSTSIPITSQVHELLVFNSSMFTPWAIGIEKGDDKHGSFANKFAQASQQAMAEPGTGYANLARLAVAAAAVTGNPRLEILAARFKMLAYASLRESMAASGSNPNLALLKQVFSVVSMEMTARQDDNSALHTRNLGQLARGYGQSVILDRRTPTDLDVRDFHRFNTSPSHHVCCQTASRVPRFWPTPLPDGFEAASINPHLLGRTREMRFIHDLCQALQYAPQFLDDALMEAFGYRAALSCCNLIDSYNDGLDQIRDSKSPTDDLYQLYSESSIGIVGAYAVRTVTNHEPIDVERRAYTQLYKIYGTHGPVLAHLREAYHFCKSSDGLVRHARLWLWLLWVTSLAERASIFPDDTAERVVEGYFHQAFVGHATVTMGLRAWEEIEAVTARFLRIQPHRATSRMYFEMAFPAAKAR
ncbi:uncharacterized protein AB675_8721 [Cyphellophora attinorum]|uniref:Uncharacterized protein n=1 Tax=Cyphellophora attinorum TaxID=1664694 RepID=A0A0N1H9V5_9EURO|nr:uncharacterized protein AB675_8721 [Phialophora attinorum]KPI44535.1 hypothetical protein AB675_8721 [Phialophora attinorum]